LNPILLKGRKVVGDEGYFLGEFSDLHVDFKVGKATAFYVTLSDEAATELGFKKPFLRRVTVCLPTELIKAVGDVITLDAPIRCLEDLAEREMQVETDRVEGKKVVNEKGEAFGKVDGLDVNVDDWSLSGFEVALNAQAASELGFKSPVLSKVVVIIPRSAVGSIENFVTLDKAVESLKSLVECIQSCQKV